MQYYCEQTPDAVSEKRRVGLIIACLAIFSCYLFMLTTIYLKNTAYLDYKLWDIHTVTPADFTIVLEITQTMWNTYKDMHVLDEELDRNKSHKEHEAHSILMDFENYLKKELTSRLNTLPHTLFEDTDLKIANISFAYDN